MRYMYKNDLADRAFEFSQNVRAFIKQLPKTTANIEDGKQVVRSSGSVGANYIEANESLSKKDLIYRLKISRKEVKETQYWLKLIDADVQLQGEKDRLIKELTELLSIFSSIINNLEHKRTRK